MSVSSNKRSFVPNDLSHVQSSNEGIITCSHLNGPPCAHIVPYVFFHFILLGYFYSVIYLGLHFHLSSLPCYLDDAYLTLPSWPILRSCVSYEQCVRAKEESSMMRSENRPELNWWRAMSGSFSGRSCNFTSSNDRF